MFKKMWLLYGVAFAALMVPDVTAAQPEHRQELYQHPCGENGRKFELNSITSYFVQRWQAHWADLKPQAVNAYVKYHNAEKLDISLVRVFRSYLQPDLAVVSARRQVNFLEGRPLVDLMCIVQITDTFSLKYSTEELEDILNTVRDDI